MTKQKVIIIGAGLAGSLLAVCLAENKAVFRFVEVLKHCLEYLQ